MPNPESVSQGKEVVDSPELEVEKNAIIQLLKEGETAQWKLGVHYNNIIDNGLAEKSGYHRAPDFFARRFENVPRSTLNLYGTVARAFPEQVAQSYGVTRLSLLLRYEKLAHLAPTAGDPGSTPVKVPTEGGVADVPFSACHKSQLAMAIQKLKGSCGAQIPAEEAEVLERLHAAFEGDEHSPIAVSSRLGREGTLVNFTLPLKCLTLLLETLEKFLRGPEAAAAARPLLEQFQKEFAKGMEEWGKTLERSDEKKS